MANKMANKKSPKIEDQRFICESCDYSTSRLSEFKRHIITAKHLRLTKNHHCHGGEFNCICGKEYTHASSLSKHKKNCKKLIVEKEEINNDNVAIEYKQLEKKEINVNTYVEVINKLLEDNNELRNLILDQSEEHKKETTNILSKVMEMKSTQVNNTIHGNVNNNRFSINMFLNDKCKDAINFTDFIHKIDVSHEDLENNAELGFVDGISKILVDNLKQLSVYERPIHCTDIKREIMYIKDQDKWQKEDDIQKIHGAIQQVSRKSISKLNAWKTENPDYKDMDSEFSTKCLAIQRQCNPGIDRDNLYPKIVKTITKETSISKEFLYTIP